MSLDTYIVEGGIGKCLSFTALLPKLVEKSGEPVQIHTPYVDVFANNPLVKTVFDANTVPLGLPEIINSDNIYYSEPYKSNWIKGDDHLIKSYCELHGIEFDVNMRPSMYTDHLKEEVDKWIKEVGIENKEIILVQFTGGQSPIGWNPGNQYVSSNAGRNYHPYFAQGIVNGLLEKYEDHVIIDVTLPNEPGPMGTLKCDRPYPFLIELLKRSKGFIGIDSLLQHMGAVTGTPGVVLWGNTRWTQFGWMHHKNMSFHDKNKYNTYYKMDVDDPRNIMIEGQDVFDTFVNKVYGKTVDESEIQVAHKVSKKKK